MTALHEANGLTCPRCEASLAGLKGEYPVGSTVGKEIRVDIDCPDCAAPLEIMIDSALLEVLGVDVWVEDRRETE